MIINVQRIQETKNKKIKIYSNKNKIQVHRLVEQLNQLNDLKEVKKLEYALFPRFVLLMEIKDLLQQINSVKKKIQEMEMYQK
jgi:triosephosphate isomerase